MATWEYATVPLIVHATKQILDQWGEDGWELVQVLPGPDGNGLGAYLKRAKASGMSAVEDRLDELGLTVPDVAKPVAAYVPALRDGNLIFTSGQLPMVSGTLVWTGKVGDGHGLVPAADATKLAQICALNAIAAVKSVIGDLDKVTRVVKVVGFVASDA